MNKKPHSAQSDTSYLPSTKYQAPGTLQIINFGCRLNSYEGEVIRAQAQAGGLENAMIFNSCAVTAEAERQVRQAIRKARKENPKARIIVTGCGAQINPKQYAEMGEVDKVIGNEEKLKSAAYASLAADCWSLPTEKILVNDIMSVKETASHMVASFDGKARAFVQVQNGCDHRCTFCIIPYGRGNSRSVPVGEIVAQTRALVARGYNEIVLTGVDITGYGKDLPGRPALGQMMRRLLTLVPDLKRLRLSSLDAVEMGGDLCRLIAGEPRLMPHLHLSLQAGDDMILKRMKRRHLRQDIIEFCREMRRLRSDVVFGADIIAGFPTETEAMFENTLSLVDEVGLTYLHVFPYSAREGTPAARMPQVKKEIRKARAAKLRAAGERRLAAYLRSQTGKTLSVLVENPRRGRSEHFAPVELDRECEVGEILPAFITGSREGKLMGTVVPARSSSSPLEGKRL